MDGDCHKIAYPCPERACYGPIETVNEQSLAKFEESCVRPFLGFAGPSYVTLSTWRYIVGVEYYRRQPDMRRIQALLVPDPYGFPSNLRPAQEAMRLAVKGEITLRSCLTG